MLIGKGEEWEEGETKAGVVWEGRGREQSVRHTKGRAGGIGTIVMAYKSQILFYAPSATANGTVDTCHSVCTTHVCISMVCV